MQNIKMFCLFQFSKKTRMNDEKIMKILIAASYSTSSVSEVFIHLINFLNFHSQFYHQDFSGFLFDFFNYPFKTFNIGRNFPRSIQWIGVY